MPAISTSKIYSALKDIGLPKNHVSQMLPKWWTTEIEQAPDGAYELALLICRRFNLELKDLLEGKATYKDVSSKVAYKHSTANDQETLKVSTQIAKALANTVLDGMNTGFSGLPNSISEVEAEIRKASYEGMLGLSSILDFCWRFGVPVIPLTNLPIGIRKMDGLVMKVSGRPVIIVSKNSKSKSWLAFILAHELGHICLGHLNINDTIVDDRLFQKISFSAGEENDDQEKQANEFALNLLGGNEAGKQINRLGPRLEPTNLAIKAMEFQNKYKRPAGHIALRYGFEFDRWVEAQMALNFINEDKDKDGILSGYLYKKIDFGTLGDDSKDLIIQLTKFNV